MEEALPRGRVPGAGCLELGSGSLNSSPVSMIYTISCSKPGSSRSLRSSVNSGFGIGPFTAVSFQLVSDYPPQGDQPQAIDTLVRSIQAGNRYQTLLGVTGSGKTFTMANIVARLDRPTLVISHNKTLAAQLYSEFKAFFPNKRRRVFRQLLRLLPTPGLHPADRHLHREGQLDQRRDRTPGISATSSLISRRDVLVVASVSCIYGWARPRTSRR
jgi:excinuclease UvrABC helicase subunit UvrB